MSLLNISPFYLFLAYLGMVLHTLTKIEEDRKTGMLTDKTVWLKNNIISFIISVLAIPMLLIMAQEELIKTYLPVNSLTAPLVGWQTQSLLKSFMTIAGKRIPKDE